MRINQNLTILNIRHNTDANRLIKQRHNIFPRNLANRFKDKSITVTLRIDYSADCFHKKNRQKKNSASTKTKLLLMLIQLHFRNDLLIKGFCVGFWTKRLFFSSDF